MLRPAQYTFAAIKTAADAPSKIASMHVNMITTSRISSSLTTKINVNMNQNTFLIQTRFLTHAESYCIIHYEKPQKEACD